MQRRDAAEKEHKIDEETKNKDNLHTHQTSKAVDHKNAVKGNHVRTSQGSIFSPPGTTSAPDVEQVLALTRQQTMAVDDEPQSEEEEHEQVASTTTKHPLPLAALLHTDRSALRSRILARNTADVVGHQQEKDPPLRQSHGHCSPEVEKILEQEERVPDRHQLAAVVKPPAPAADVDFEVDMGYVDEDE
ncbi:unnamed protein product [Amoebophrya sp. A120]|nr:unnamed protein product [Amoebophrya sp. A120]|eukprot:GSA120T00014740001.1